MVNADVISMPDKWEYPWYAAWDLAFHCLPLAAVDPDFAKQQLQLMLKEHYLHPNGQIPAYEWNFGDVNPPVHAWATLYVYHIDKADPRRRGRRRLPQVDLPEAAAQLHVVGQPQGPHRPQRLRGRVPRAGQHRRVRPQLAAADRRVPRAGRRHGVDGVLQPVHARDRARAVAPRRRLRRHRAEVQRALPVDRLRDGPHRRARRRDVGRGGRVLLRRPAPAGRHRDAAQGPLDGRAAVAVRHDGHHAADASSTCRSSSSACRSFLDRNPELVANVPDPHKPGVGRPPAARAAQRGQAPPRPEGAARREGVPQRLRHPLALAAPRRPPVRLPPRRAGVPRRLRAGGIDQRDVRRQLQLARADLDAGEHPAVPRAAEALRLLRRRLQGRMPDRLRKADEPVRGRRRRSATASPPSSAATPTAGGRCTAGWSCSSPTRTGATTSCSTSTSTATTAPASAPATRPAGPATVATLIQMFGFAQPAKTSSPARSSARCTAPRPRVLSPAAPAAAAAGAAVPGADRAPQSGRRQVLICRPSLAAPMHAHQPTAFADFATARADGAAPEFSMVLGGPLYQLFRRLRIVREPLDLLTRRIVCHFPAGVAPAARADARQRPGVGRGEGPVPARHRRPRPLPVSLPLLIVAEWVVHMRFRPLVGQFLARDLIAPEDRPRFDQIIASSFRLRNSVLAEVILLVLVFTGGQLLWRTQGTLHTATWYADNGPDGLRLHRGRDAATRSGACRSTSSCSSAGTSACSSGADSSGRSRA